MEIAKKGLEKVTERQHERANNLYHPLTETIKANKSPDPKATHIIRNHLPPSRGDTRNKFNRLNEVRQRHKLEMLNLRRTQANEKQNQKQLHDTYTQQQDFDIDIDQLIEEERELKMDDYEKELEAYFQEMQIGESQN